MVIDRLNDIEAFLAIMEKGSLMAAAITRGAPSSQSIDRWRRWSAPWRRIWSDA